MASKPGTTTIDPDGDVILEVSSQQNGEGVSLLVSSRVLSLASPVFAKMLGPDFQEGSHKASASDMAKVRLPEDDSAAMAIFCQAVHHQSNSVPKPVTPIQLESLAILCDKYDCTKALKPWTIVWLMDALDLKPSNEDSIKLFFAAYVFDIPNAFSTLSWTVIFSHGGPVTALQGLTGYDLLPDSILGTTCMTQSTSR